MNVLARPGLEEVVPFYRGYLEAAEGDNLLDALVIAADRMRQCIARVPAGGGGHRYAEGKWSIKEVVQHVIDTERIFAYRALCFARGERAHLPGFDENDYAGASDADRRELDDLLHEHDAVHIATLALFRSFSPDMLLRSGVASERSFTVRALGWSIAGHALHHVHILDQRYLTHGRT